MFLYPWPLIVKMVFFCHFVVSIDTVNGVNEWDRYWFFEIGLIFIFPILLYGEQIIRADGENRGKRVKINDAAHFVAEYGVLAPIENIENRKWTTCFWLSPFPIPAEVSTPRCLHECVLKWSLWFPDTDRGSDHTPGFWVILRKLLPFAPVNPKKCLVLNFQYIITFVYELFYWLWSFAAAAVTQIFLKIPHFAVCELSNNRNKVGEYNFVCRRKRKANIVIIFDGGRLRGSTASLLQCLANNRATSQQKCFCKTWQLIGVCIFSTAKQIYLAWTLWLLWLAGNFDDVGF